MIHLERSEIIVALKEAGYDNTDFEAKLLFENFSGQGLINAVQRRCSGEPLQYILGEWDFYDMTLKVGPGVLIPRSDTERLCDVALEKLKGIKAPKVLDLCAGSGCISAIILSHSDAAVTAVEKSADAFPYLSQNLKQFGERCEIVRGDVITTQFDTCFDMIVSNPPYISVTKFKTLDEGLKYEPEMALIAPEDGLYFYKQIAKIYKKNIKPDGYIIFEIGHNQRNEVSDILKQNGYKNISCTRDYGGNDRVIAGQV